MKTFIVFVCLVVAVRAAPKLFFPDGKVVEEREEEKPQEEEEVVSYEPNPSYEFSYAVEDRDTYDVKGHSETRKDGVVTGTYYSVSAEGDLIRFDYRATPEEGYTVKMTKEEGLYPSPPEPKIRKPNKKFRILKGKPTYLKYF